MATSVAKQPHLLLQIRSNMLSTRKAVAIMPPFQLTFFTSLFITNVIFLLIHNALCKSQALILKGSARA